MPKLFPISLEVEEAALGRILRLLNVMPGVSRLNLNLQNSQRQLAAPQAIENEEYEERAIARSLPALRDGRSFTQGYRAKKNTIHHNPAYRAIAEVLVKTPAHFRILMAAIERQGLSSSGIHGYLRRLKQTKCIIKTAPGSYRLTEKGAKTFFGEGRKETNLPGETPPQNFGKVKDNNAGVRALVLETLAKNGKVPASVLGATLEKSGYSSKNMSTTGIKMRSEGLIEFEDGVYSITEEGMEIYNNRPDPAKSTQQEEGLNANG